MSNPSECPDCHAEIDATAAAKWRRCPECKVSFSKLVRIATPDENDPHDAGPYYEVEA